MTPCTVATWYDRDSSRKTTAKLWFDGDEANAENDDGERRRAVLARIDISPRLANVPRRLVFPDGVSLSVADNDFIDRQLATRRRQRTAAVIDRMEKRWHWLLLLLLAGGGIIYTIAVGGVPAAAHAIADRIAIAQLQKLTQTTYQQLLQNRVLLPSRATLTQQRRAKTLFNNVAAAYPTDDYHYRLSIHAFTYGVATANKAENGDAGQHFGLVNAFALPDGLIIATDALLAVLEDDEIIAIFAHEIGHVHHRHGVRSLLQAAGIGIFLTFAFGDVSTVLLVSSFLLNLKYSRDFEHEADCHAFAYLETRGLPTTLIRDSLRKLEDINAPNWGNTETDKADETAKTESASLTEFLLLLSTHPDTEERINQACPST